MTLFSSGYRITQKYGNNPTYYSQWGFSAHEGLDCVPANLQQSWDVLTPEKIEIVRDYDTPRDNYGVMVVGICWETKRSWWFCHLEKNYCAIGDVIEAGQPVGKMGNTGNSSGAHLHLGCRECDSNGNPINLNNGYKGFIDPLPLLEKSMSTISIETSVFEKLVNKSSLYDQFVELGYTSAVQLKAVITKLEADLQAKQNAIDENVQDLKEVMAELEEVREEFSNQGERLTKAHAQIEALTTQANSQTLTIASLEKEVKDLTLKLSSIPENENLTPTISNVIALFRLWLKGWLRNGI
jgi:polyhydroxyalkanoate synthesis regulator phasin